MAARGSFMKRNKLLVNSLIATGNWYLGFDGLIASPTGRLLLRVYSVLQKVWFIISSGSLLAYTLLGGETSQQTLLKNLFVNIGTLQYLSYLIFFVMHRHSFRRFIQLWDDSFKNDPFPFEARQTFEAEQSKNKIIFSGLMVPMVCTAVMYFPMFLVFDMREANGDRSLPLKPLLSFDTNKSPGYEMVVILQMGMCLTFLCKIVGFSMVYYTLVSQQTAKVKHLAFWLAKLCDPEPDMPSMSTSSVPDEESEEVQLPTAKFRDASRRIDPETRIDLAVGFRRLPRAARRAVRTMRNPSHELLKERLRLWVQHHQQAIRTAREMNRLFSRVLMEKILLVPLLLSYLTYIMFNKDSDLEGVLFLSAVSYILFCIAEMLVFFRYGDGLIAAHALLAEVTTTSQWVDLRTVPVIGSSLKIIEHGVRIPMAVKSMGFFPISSAMFVDIITRAYTGVMVIAELQRH